MDISLKNMYDMLKSTKKQTLGANIQKGKIFVLRHTKNGKNNTKKNLRYNFMQQHG